MVLPSQVKGFKKIYVQTPKHMTYAEKYERFWMINGNDPRIMTNEDVSKWVNDSIRNFVKDGEILVWGFKANKKEVIFSSN